MNQNDSLLTKNQKTGLIIVGFSFLIGLMVFLVGTGVLILSLSLFGFGVYMFFKKEKPIDTTISYSYKEIPGLLKYSIITNKINNKEQEEFSFSGPIEDDFNDNPIFAGDCGNPFSSSESNLFDD